MAIKKTINKYAVENLPLGALSDKTKEGLEKGVFIDILSALGVMMNLQDGAYEEEFSDLKCFLKNLTIEQRNAFARIESRLTSIELRLDTMETEMKKLREKDTSLEQQIREVKVKLQELELELENHKHDII